MILLILFAFLGGVVTILSPCILPILPIILSGSVTGGKRRPLGIATGFILSFAFFTLFLAAIVRATGVSADTFRMAAVIIVLAFGVSMFIPKAQAWVTELFSRLPKLQLKHADKESFWGGVLLGCGIGLVWTPCVGPILASIITIAATATVGSEATLIMLAYATGTAIPLLAITYGGRKLLTRHQWLVRNSDNIQKAFGVFMIITALAILFNVDRKFQSYVLTAFPQYGVGLTKFEDNPTVAQELEKLKSRDGTQKVKLNLANPFPESAPELILGGQWFNLPVGIQALTLEGLRGKVVLIDFWTYTCINCIRTLPYIQAWHEKYKDKGLVIIGVHTPEFEFEKNPDNVEAAIKDFKLTYPVMQDNDFATWNAYRNRYWPAKYFIDKDGKIRWTHFGEGAYDESEDWIQTLLRETGATVEEVTENPSYDIRARTPELYLGYRRMEYLASPEKLVFDQEQTYSAPSQLPLHSFAFAGTWTVEEKRAIPHNGASLTLQFDAAHVFLVMRPETDGAIGTVRVLLDGQSVSGDADGEDVNNGIVAVNADRLYKIIELTEPGKHTLKLDFTDGNVELYAFTFG